MRSTARGFSVSTRRLSRSICASTNLASHAVGDHGSVARRAAAHRLASTAAPLAGVAVDAGFSDQAHMTRAFARRTGLTPVAFAAPRARLRLQTFNTAEARGAMMSSMSLRLLILIAFALTRCATSTPLHDLLAKYEQQGFSGSVLVAKDGRIVLHRGYGFADRARGIRNDTNTLYEVGSVNKIFTAAAILQLELRGALRTSDPLSKHLGTFPRPKDEATIHHLALHSAGLIPEGSDVGSADREQFIANVKSVAAESRPGERYRYTNAGYSVLAAIIEKISGLSYERYVRENLWKDVHFRGEPAHNLARGYDDEGKDTVPPAMIWGTRGAGGMVATVESIYRWHVALRAAKVLDPAQTEKMFTPRENEGYAWHVERDAAGRRIIHKGGGMPQYAAQIIEYPDERLVIVWASNDLQKRWRQDLNRGIAEVARASDPP